MLEAMDAPCMPAHQTHCLFARLNKNSAFGPTHATPGAFWQRFQHAPVSRNRVVRPPTTIASNRQLLQLQKMLQVSQSQVSPGPPHLEGIAKAITRAKAQLVGDAEEGVGIGLVTAIFLGKCSGAAFQRNCSSFLCFLILEKWKGG